MGARVRWSLVAILTHAWETRVRRIRRLRDLLKQGTAVEQRFVRYLVASQSDVDPASASSRQSDAAWRSAEDWWERAVRDFNDQLEKRDLDKAEDLARRQLQRIALARLKLLGWV
jgi:hypothetical protein